MTPTTPVAPAARATRRLPLPAQAVGEWLAEIDDVAELKVTLRAAGLLAEGVSRGGTPPSLAVDELLDDPFLAQGLASDAGSGANVSGADDRIRRGLRAALRRGALAAVRSGGEVRIFLNDGAAQRYFEQARLTPWSPAGGVPPDAPAPVAGLPAAPAGGNNRANIFALYERHIGPYGHNVAEQLRAAEQEFPAQWIEDAFALAAARDKPNWYYVWGILRRWHREGRQKQRYDDGKPGHDTAPDSRTGYLDYYRRRYGRLPWESGGDESGRNAA